ncbi:MAG: B12-binding domain-containing radical SAM protein [Bacteroidia bacterium]
MKILFVWPNKDGFGFKPMSLALLSAELKQRGHEVELFDTTYIDFGYKGLSDVRNKIKIFKPVDFSKYDMDKHKLDLQAELKKKLDDFQPDVIGISALSDEVSIGLQVSKIIKQWNSNLPVLWGNKAPTMFQERILEDPYVDYICIGEGIEFMVEFLDCLTYDKNLTDLKNIAYKDEQGRIRRNELRPYFQDLDSLPYLDWSIFDFRHFLKPYDGNLYIGGDHMIYWGCPSHCTYCINHAYRNLYGTKAGKFIRCYSVDRIINELKFLVQKWGINFFKFHDEDFCIKPLPYFRYLSEEYRKHINIPFTAMVNAHNITKEKIELLAQMNCVSISIGIETGNEKLRKEVLKRHETKEEIIKAIHLLNDAGIRTCAFNMLGIPFETRKTIMETIELNRKSQVRYLRWSGLVRQPGG